MKVNIYNSYFAPYDDIVFALRNGLDNGISKYILITLQNNIYWKFHNVKGAFSPHPILNLACHEKRYNR